MNNKTINICSIYGLMGAYAGQEDTQTYYLIDRATGHIKPLVFHSTVDLLKFLVTVDRKEECEMWHKYIVVNTEQ